MGSIPADKPSLALVTFGRVWTGGVPLVGSRGMRLRPRVAIAMADAPQRRISEGAPLFFRIVES